MIRRIAGSIAVLSLVAGCGSATPSPTPAQSGAEAQSSSGTPPGSSLSPASPPPASIEPSPLPDPVLTARIDGGNWEITHTVTKSDDPTLAVGDLTIRVYQNVKYRCSNPPCGVTLKTDDPNTVDLPRAATFDWRDGAYVSVDKQRAIDRCVAPDGSVVRDAYDVVITTTLRVAAVGDRNGVLLATKLKGDQSRQGTPRAAAAAHGCRPWTATFDSSGQRNVMPGQATTVRSRNWAGYVVSRDDARITEVHGSWTQPAVRCDGASRQFSSFWIGIDGSSNDTLEQLGTEGNCRNGTPIYGTWWETIPDSSVPTPLDVKPGDYMSAAIRSVGDRYTMSLRNVTSGKAFSKTVDWPRAEGASAEWIAEASALCPPEGCVVQVLPDFGVVRFEDAVAATGSSGLLPPTDPAWGLERSVMITAGGRTKAEVSPLGVGGDTFNVTWRPLS
jgi:hypothetical protein